MNAEQKYGEVIKELGDVLHKKNNEIMVQKFQIEELTRLLKAVDTYVSKDDYNKYRRQAAEWCAPHVDEDDAIDTDQIYQNLPEYETLLHYFIHKDRMDGRYESVIEKTMKDNKNLRWYFITPGMLTFNYGGRIV